MADSNRLAPGMGHTVFPAILRMLKHMNYSGWISVEILANGDPDGLADHAIRHLRACGV